jgi:predicted  nucleic acid-binding Zn-ribbon protein
MDDNSDPVVYYTDKIVDLRAQVDALRKERDEAEWRAASLTETVVILMDALSQIEPEIQHERDEKIVHTALDEAKKALNP